MTGFEQLERELIAAAGRRRHTPMFASARSVAGTIALVGSVLATLVVATVFISTLGARSAKPPQARPAVSPGNMSGAFALTPCTYLRGRTPTNRTFTVAAPDSRLVALLGVLRRRSKPVDSGTYPRCAALAAGAPTVHARYVRYLAPGITGGKVFLVPVSGNRQEAPTPPNLTTTERARARRYLTAPAVCLVTVGYLGTMSGVGGCVPLGAVQQAFRHSLPLGLSSTEIVNAPPEQQALAQAGFPPQLRSGSIVSALVPDDVARIVVRYGHEPATTVTVHDNYFQFHTSHSAPVAARAQLQLLNARGHVLGVVKPG